MGLYDYLVDGDKVCQVKCFDCDMLEYSPGDEVPMDGDFSIALMEGGWANVDDGTYVGMTEDPLHQSRIDKWGGAYDPECYGEKHPYKPIWSPLVSEEGHF